MFSIVLTSNKAYYPELLYNFITTAFTKTYNLTNDLSILKLLIIYIIWLKVHALMLALMTGMYQTNVDPVSTLLIDKTLNQAEIHQVSQLSILAQFFIFKNTVNVKKQEQSFKLGESQPGYFKCQSKIVIQFF